MTEPGFYQSDVDGHLFVYKNNPTRVCCLACVDVCDGSKYATQEEFVAAAQAFMDKHGAITTRIALRIEPWDSKT